MNDDRCSKIGHADEAIIFTVNIIVSAVGLGDFDRQIVCKFDRILNDDVCSKIGRAVSVIVSIVGQGNFHLQIICRFGRIMNDDRCSKIGHADEAIIFTVSTGLSVSLLILFFARIILFLTRVILFLAGIITVVIRYFPTNNRCSLWLWRVDGCFTGFATAATATAAAADERN